MTQTYRDGNALAGPLAEVFSFDITMAVAVCSGCGRTDRIATLHVYGGELGHVARCPGCDTVVLRYAPISGRGRLDLRGAASLRLPVEDEAGSN